MRASELSIVIPVKNDAKALLKLLAQLGNSGCEVVVADGGSADLQALPAGVHWLRCRCSGRGQQLAEGAAHSRRQWLWFLHADSELEPSVLKALLSLEEPAWGCFDVQLDSGSWLLRWVSRLMNARSKITGICTGDQGIFVHRSLLDRIGGFPAQTLMEDIELSRRLKREQRAVRLAGTIVTSARRWEQHGIWPTIFLMWSLRLRYWFGASPEALAARYYR